MLFTNLRLNNHHNAARPEVQPPVLVHPPTRGLACGRRSVPHIDAGRHVLYTPADDKQKVMADPSMRCGLLLLLY